MPLNKQIIATFGGAKVTYWMLWEGICLIVGLVKVD